LCLSIDATDYDFGGQVYGREVREVNDVNGMKEGSTSNCSMQVNQYKEKPHLVIVATKKVEPGDELVYDYADNMEARVSHLNSFTAVLNAYILYKLETARPGLQRVFPS
jgi:hypothetical protein